MIINQQIMTITITRNLSIVEKTIKSLPSGKTNIICYIYKRKGHKAFQYWNWKQKDFYQNIRTYSQGQTYFFALEYDIILEKSNLLVDFSATKHVITDKSKFWTGETFCWLSWWKPSE